MDTSHVVVPLATREDIAYSNGLVRNNLSRKMTDDHLWMSLMRRKTDTNFSRLQRLGVCFSILFMTMIANAMWYGVGEDGANASTKIHVGPISFSLNALFTSVLGALCVVPVTGAITVFFLKSAKRKKPRFDVIESITDLRAHEEWFGSISSFSSDSRADSQSRIPRSLGVYAADGGDASESVVDESDDVDEFFDEKELEKLENMCFDQVSTPLKMTDKTRKKKKKFELPWWFQYIGWVLVAGSIVTAGVFVIFYAMDWGKAKSEEWLITFFLSTFQSMLLIQPLKVSYWLSHSLTLSSHL
jgi:polycystin 1L2